MKIEIIEGKKRKVRKWPQKARIAPRKRLKPRKVKWPKFNKSDLQRADSAFSKRIIERDKKCRYPGCQVSDPAKLTCSHYHGRAIKNTRFDEDNCIALCRTHHFWDKQLGWEFQKQTIGKHGWDGKYTTHMWLWLGEARFVALTMRALLPFDRELYSKNLLPFKKKLASLSTSSPQE